ncbi:MAG: hypothetical protein Q4D98_00695 [Planctomycetia bacterium]|nr:hypothetical protein [Planctomycetia bacterium]
MQYGIMAELVYETFRQNPDLCVKHHYGDEFGAPSMAWGYFLQVEGMEFFQIH